MGNASLGVAGERSRKAVATPGLRQRADRSIAGHEVDVPVLESRDGALAQRFAEALPNRHPVTVFLAAAFAGYTVLAALSVALGLVLTMAVLRIDGVASADDRFVPWLVAQRSPALTQLSLIGSIVAGGVVIPTLVGLVAFALALRRRWRIAAFLIAAITIEAATYRASTLFVHRDRPHVARLEDLPASASYPSGHTAAAIAVYCGLALVLTSRFRNGWFRLACWTVALAIPPFVALGRMYRGMHHPLDCLIGVPIGVLALVVAVFASRAAGVAAERRRKRTQEARA
jgi:membrane-associated phospholipid phosphatase